MPDHLRALLVLLPILGVAWLLVERPAYALGISAQDFRNRRLAWFLTTVLVFLSSNFWLAMGAVLFVCLTWGKKDSNPVAFYLSQLLCLPLASEQVSGLGLFGYLVDVNHSRVAAVALLLPVAYRLWGARDHGLAPKKSLLPLKFMLAYFGLLFCLSWPLSNSILGLARATLVYPLVDALMLAYVAMNILEDRRKLRDLLASFAVCVSVLSAVAVFEFGKHWLLYETLSSSLGRNPHFGAYVLRGDGILRAIATTGQPIVLGFIAALALVIVIGLDMIRSSKSSFILYALLVAGVIVPVSRGPWLGFAAGLLAMILLTPRRTAVVLLLSAGVGAFALLAMFTEIGKRAASYLPFVGDVDSATIDYRGDIVAATIRVLEESPFFGAYDYFLREDMQALRQGQGIIDIVNSYAGVSLNSGLVGLSFFASVFLSAILLVLTMILRADPKKDSEGRGLAVIVLGCLVTTVVTIYTVSSISFIPLLCWLWVGCAMAVSRQGLRTPGEEAGGRGVGSVQAGPQASLF